MSGYKVYFVLICDVSLHREVKSKRIHSTIVFMTDRMLSLEHFLQSNQVIDLKNLDAKTLITFLQPSFAILRHRWSRVRTDHHTRKSGTLQCSVLASSSVHYSIVLHHNLSYHITSYYIISYHIISYHITSHHIIPHYIIFSYLLYCHSHRWREGMTSMCAWSPTHTVCHLKGNILLS